jgi:alpha-D-xyloside xylohydrolase
VRAAAPVEQMPLYVRAGSIVPTGPAIQHTAEKPADPITLHVYTGADGSFSLYEDDGVSRQYLNGAFARIPIRYDDRSGTLTIGAREGSFPGMLQSRTFNIRWISAKLPRGLDPDGKADATIRYTGAQQRVVLEP